MENGIKFFKEIKVIKVFKENEIIYFVYYFLVFIVLLLIIVFIYRCRVNLNFLNILEEYFLVFKGRFYYL